MSQFCFNLTHRKNLLALLISIFCCHYLHAQEKKLISEVEIFGGTSLLHNTGYYGDSKLKSGHTYGLGISHSLSNSFKLNLRVGYDFKGSIFQFPYVRKESNSSPFEQVVETDNTTFKYLTATMTPVFLLGKKKRVEIGIGGYYSRLTTASMTYSRLVNSSVTEKGYYAGLSGTARDLFNHQYDCGFSFSLGYGLAISKQVKILLRASENLGLVDINCAQLGSQRNRAFTVSASLVINRKRR